MNITYIYILERNNIPFYVGKTTNYRSRERQHKLKFGKDIFFITIDECISQRINWEPLECYWIEQFKQWGFKLENKNKGGSGVTYHSQETKDKMSLLGLGKSKPNGFGEKISKATTGNKNVLGKKWNKESRDKMSIYAKNRPQEHKDKIIKSNTGQERTKGAKRSEETKINMRKPRSEEAKINMKGPKSQEHKDNISKAKKGMKNYWTKKLTQDHKNKISNALKNKPFSQEHKDKISKSKIGKKHKLETLDKMSKTRTGMKYKSKLEHNS